MIVHTNELEKTQSQSSTSYQDCLKGTNLRRTEIACMAWMAQPACGVGFGSNSLYFLEQAGLDPIKAFDFTLGLNRVTIAANAISWFVMLGVGWRSLYLFALNSAFVLLLVIGFLGVSAPTSAYAYATGVLRISLTVTYNLTLGPIALCPVAEIPSTQLRIKTAVLAQNSYNVASICANVLNPPTRPEPTRKRRFVRCGSCFLTLVSAYFRLPEPQNQSPAELCVLFENRMPAGKSRNFQLDAFRSDNLIISDEYALVMQQDTKI
jgi:MFS transporter, SP family, general alpha glucoside:H+ symporter